VYAVSPGAATDTKVVRNAGPALKYLFSPKTEVEWSKRRLVLFQAAMRE
jgi:hypothetical protein